METSAPAGMPKLLPDLTTAQTQFAYRYYPVFEDLKNIILLASGAMLLVGHQQMTVSDYQEQLVQAQRVLEIAASNWQALENGSPESTAVTEVSVSISELQKAFAGLSAETQLELADLQDHAARLSNIYRRLRLLALHYWRLELVGETDPHHH